MQLTNEEKATVDSNESHVSVTLSFPNHEIEDITNDQIYLESMSLDESLLDSDSLVFGKCNGAVFKIKVADFDEDIKNAEMHVTLNYENEKLGDLELPFGKYIVNSAERTSDRRFRNITAYDFMSKFDVDIADWYNNTLFPSIKETTDLGWKIEDDGISLEASYIQEGVPGTSKNEYDIDALYVDSQTGYGYVGVGIYNEETSEFDHVEWVKTYEFERNILETQFCNIRHSINEILEMLCEHIGVEYDKDYTFVNGEVLIEKCIEPADLKGRNFLEQICEANGVFGHFNNQGILTFIQPKYESYIDSNNTLHVNDPFFVKEGSKYSINDKFFRSYSKDKEQVEIELESGSVISAYKECVFEDYDVESVNTLQIRNSKDEIGIIVSKLEEHQNEYIITGNTLLYGISNKEELKQIANNILDLISNVHYRPNKTVFERGIYNELGATLQINARVAKGTEIEEITFSTIVLNRTLSGIQSITSSVEAKGKQYQDGTNKSVADSINILNSQSRDIDELLTALKANFDSLNAKAITTNTIEANVGKFGYLKADLANIDIADIKQATIQDLLVKSAWFDKAIMEYGYAFQLVGDIIKAKTLALEELVFVDDITKPSKNLVYHMNDLAGGLDTETYTEEELSQKLNGTDLIANSVTAKEINVENLTSNEAFIRNLFAQNINATGSINGALIENSSNDYGTTRLSKGRIITRGNLSGGNYAAYFQDGKITIVGANSIIPLDDLIPKDLNAKTLITESKHIIETYATKESIFSNVATFDSSSINFDEKKNEHLSGRSSSLSTSELFILDSSEENEKSSIINADGIVVTKVIDIEEGNIEETIIDSTSVSTKTFYENGVSLEDKYASVSSVSTLNNDLNAQIENGYLGKNLLKPTLYGTVTQGNYTCVRNSDGTYTVNGSAGTGANFDIGSVELEAGVYLLNGSNGGSWSTYSLRANNKYYQLSGSTRIELTERTTLNFVIYINSNATISNVVFKPMLVNAEQYPSITYDDYVPYCPPNTKITELNNSLMDVKMLGWTVPSDCPIQNIVSGNTFTQRVGRVDLSSLSWSYNNDGYYYATLTPTLKRTSGAGVNANMYSHSYNVTSQQKWTTGDKNICYLYTASSETNSMLLVKDTSLGTNGKPSGYLYYELATPITMTIDGNEAVERLNTSLDDYGLVNQFDGVLYQKYLSSEGTESYSEDTHAVCSGYLSCEANDIVSIKCKHNYTDTRICFYDSNKNFISKLDNGVVQGKAPSNAKYYRFHFWNESGILVNNAKDKIFAYINNEIEGLKADLTSLVKIVSNVQDDISISANGNSSTFAAITAPTGYTAISCNYNIANATNGGTNASVCQPFKIQKDGYCTIHNNSSSAAKIKITRTVTFMLSSCVTTQ